MNSIITELFSDPGKIFFNSIFNRWSTKLSIKVYRNVKSLNGPQNKILKDNKIDFQNCV